VAIIMTLALMVSSPASTDPLVLEKSSDPTVMASSLLGGGITLVSVTYTGRATASGFFTGDAVKVDPK